MTSAADGRLADPARPACSRTFQRPRDQISSPASELRGETVTKPRSACRSALGSPRRSPARLLSGGHAVRATQCSAPSAACNSLAWPNTGPDIPRQLGRGSLVLSAGRGGEPCRSPCGPCRGCTDAAAHTTSTSHPGLCSDGPVGCLEWHAGSSSPHPAPLHHPAATRLPRQTRPLPRCRQPPERQQAQ